MGYSQYKVIQISEGGCSTLLFGSAPIAINKIEHRLNKEAKDGWQVVFQVIEKRRFLLLFTRESMVVTLGK